MSKLPEGIVTPGIRNNFSYFFFRTGDGNDPNSDELQFGYPDWYLDNAPSNISLLVKDYILFYRSLRGYDPERKTILDFSVFNDQTTSQFINLIKKTAEIINKIYEKS